MFIRSKLNFCALLALFVALAVPMKAHAALLSGFGDPLTAIPGGSQETFDSAVPGTYSSFTASNGVTITPDQGVLYIDNAYSGSYNNPGQSLHNCYCSDSFGALTFNLSGPASAFAFNFGASDQSWTLSAYDSSNTLLESDSVGPTFSSNAGDFFGISTGVSNIAKVTLTGASSDYVFVDNVTVSAVPLPGSVGMFGSALLGLVGFAGTRRKLSASLVA